MREKHASRRNDRLTSPTPTRRRLRRRLRQMFPSLAATPCTPAAACHAHHNWAGREGATPEKCQQIVMDFVLRCPFVGWLVLRAAARGRRSSAGN